MIPVLESLLLKYQASFHPVVAFNEGEARPAPIDLSIHNPALTEAVFSDTPIFTHFIKAFLQSQGAGFAVGGYNEKRNIYLKSPLFNESDIAKTGPRNIHLGVDIWGPADTAVFAFMGGMVHSFAFNQAPGDYGATLVLLHQLEGIPFYSLYGHLSLKDIQLLNAGQYVVVGQTIGHFGNPEENGNWPPHLHFQLILDMELKEGDYPGVCTELEAPKLLANCPDPTAILQLEKYI